MNGKFEFTTQPEIPWTTFLASMAIVLKVPTDITLEVTKWLGGSDGDTDARIINLNGMLTAYCGRHGETRFARIGNQNHEVLKVIGRKFKVQIFDEDGMRYASLSFVEGGYDESSDERRS